MVRDCLVEVPHWFMMIGHGLIWTRNSVVANHNKLVSYRTNVVLVRDKVGAACLNTVPVYNAFVLVHMYIGADDPKPIAARHYIV